MRATSARLLLPILLLQALLAAQAPGTQERKLDVGGTPREYLLHIPRGFRMDADKPVPLVVMLHGRTRDGRSAASSYYGWTALADQEGFVAAFPTALGTPTSWQLALGGGETPDTKFLLQLIDTLVAELHLDQDRVFLTGHSSGGFMSYSFAALHADKVAAIAPVAGLRVGREEPEVPVSVISFHGMADDVVAYDAEHGKQAIYRGLPSAPASAGAFAKFAGCRREPERTDLCDGKVHLDTWIDGKNGTRVELYSLEGWGHGWPNANSGCPATPRIWQFFQQHARRPQPAAAAGAPK